MSNVPTDRRATVRVLLRGAGGAAEEGRTRKIAGYLVIVLSQAKPEDWPGITLEPGDLEAVTWTTPRQVAQTVANLEASGAIVAAHAYDE